MKSSKIERKEMIRYNHDIHVKIVFIIHLQTHVENA